MFFCLLGRHLALLLQDQALIPALEEGEPYLGDYSRTGAGAILMPGTRVGAYTMVGAGVLAQGNIPPRSCVLLEQTHITKPWGEEKYGW